MAFLGVFYAHFPHSYPHFLNFSDFYGAILLLSQPFLQIAPFMSFREKDRLETFKPPILRQAIRKLLLLCG